MVSLAYLQLICIVMCQMAAPFEGQFFFQKIDTTDQKRTSYVQDLNMTLLIKALSLLLWTNEPTEKIASMCIRLYYCSSRREVFMWYSAIGVNKNSGFELKKINIRIPCRSSRYERFVNLEVRKYDREEVLRHSWNWKTLFVR